MNAKEKLIAGISATAFLSFVGYCIYKFVQSRNSEDYASEDASDCESEEEHQTPLIDLMDLVLLESFEVFIEHQQYLDVVNRSAEVDAAEARIAIQQMVTRKLTIIETSICQSKGWTAQEYNDAVEQRCNVNDPEVMRRLEIMQSLLVCTLENRPFKVHFEVDALLTPEKTIFLYKWILFCHLYTTYKTAQKFANDGKYISQEQSEKVTQEISEAKDTRRTLLLKRAGIQAKNTDSYRIEFLKAFWMYKLNDQEFKQIVDEVSNIFRQVSEGMGGDLSEIFATDPFDLTEKDFAACYEKAKKIYIVSPKEEKKEVAPMMEESEEPKATESTVYVSENYTSIDRMIRKDKPKPKREPIVLSQEEKENLIADCEALSKDPLDEPVESKSESVTEENNS